MSGRAAAAFVIFILLTGCSFPLPAPTEPMQYFVIESHRSSVKAPGMERFPLRVLVRDTTSSPFINGRKIIFSQSASTRGYYQFASWVEPPPKAFTEIVLKRFSEADAFQSVVRVASAAIADIQLSTDLEEFHHDISSTPGKAQVVVTAELVDLRSRDLIGRKSFKYEEDVSSYDVEGATKAINEAAEKIVDEMLLWVVDQLKARPK